MEATGYCWNCGKILRPQKLWTESKDFTGWKDYWCNEKCKNLWERKQERYVHKGKKRGYGLAGSTH